MSKIPKAFISYSHDSEEHKAWVLEFAKELLKRGIDVILDQWDLRLGQDLNKFMADGVEESDRVLVICTPNYVRKANDRSGGAGYEGMIIDTTIAEDLKTTKFIPIVRRSDDKDKLPRFLKGRLYVDMQDEKQFSDGLNDLVHDIHNVLRVSKPSVGKSPFAQIKTTGTFDTTENIRKGRTDKWQDDENLFRDARFNLENRVVEPFSARPEIKSKLGLHEFDGDDAQLQSNRMKYFNQVLSILSGPVGKREAVEIWLAGVDQHNRSLSYKNKAENIGLHHEEIDKIHHYLTDRASSIADDEVRSQIQNWLGIHRHNMTVMRK